MSFEYDAVEIIHCLDRIHNKAHDPNFSDSQKIADITDKLKEIFLMLHERVETLTMRVGTNPTLDVDENIVNHDSRSGTLEGESTDYESRIVVLETAKADHETRITTLETESADYETRITTNASGVATNVTNISGNDTDIAGNDTDIATNVTNISSNDTELADHETRITALEV